MKQSLRARLTGDDWADQLPWVMLGIRTTVKEDLGTSSAEMLYGSPLAVPGDFAAVKPGNAPIVEEHLRTMRTYAEALHAKPTSRHGSHTSSVPEVLRTAQFVFIRRDMHKTPLATPYDGPYRVLRRSDKTFVVQLGTREETISIDRLKPAHVDSTIPPPVAQPPRRGRPPKAPPAVPVPVPTPPQTHPAKSANTKPTVATPLVKMKNKRPIPQTLIQTLPPAPPAKPLSSGRVPRPVVRYQP